MATDKDPGQAMAGAMFSAAKGLYKEGKKMERGRRAVRREYFAPEPKYYQNEIVSSVMARAIRNAKGNSNALSSRDLFYAVRPLAYAHHGWSPGKELGYNYFTQTLLTQYQEQHGAISGLWRDPRGHFTEPHGGAAIELGTREVGSYQLPEYVFGSILYVEKEGELDKLQEANIPERFDMAIASGKGQPVEAVRSLFERAEASAGDYKLFVFHDADIDGYGIARVMREATRRMPGYNVEVIDLGLTVEDALDMGIEGEPFSRQNRTPHTILKKFNHTEYEYLERRRERFELNSILPVSTRMEYVERKLTEAGASKVIPPEKRLSELAEEIYQDRHADWVDAAIEELVDLNAIKSALAEEFKDRHDLGSARGHIEERFASEPGVSWRKALKDKLDTTNEGLGAELARALEQKLSEGLAHEREEEEG